MTVKSKLVSRGLWLTILLLLASCVRTGNTVGPMSQFVLQQNSPQTIEVPQGIWTLHLDYRFVAQTASASSGLLTMESTLTLNNPGIKRVLLRISFVDAENKVLGETVLLDLSSFPSNPIVTKHEFRTPAGTVAIAIRGTTRGFQPGE